MKLIKTKFDGLYLIDHKVYRDSRGFFLEIQKDIFFKIKKINTKFVQENHSRSKKNVLRGLHFNKTNPQCQLVTVIRGKIFDVVVDLRPNSKTFSKWFGVILSEKGIRQIYMQKGFAHGFCVMSDYADLHYRVTENYNVKNEAGLYWNDPDLNIKWPTKNPIINKRDNNFPKFREIFKQLTK